MSIQTERRQLFIVIMEDVMIVDQFVIVLHPTFYLSTKEVRSAKLVDNGMERPFKVIHWQFANNLLNVALFKYSILLYVVLHSKKNLRMEEHTCKR